MRKPVKISDAEWQVMNVVWNHGPMMATEVLTALGEEAQWKQKTVNTFLTRLVEKGYLSSARKGRAFVYSPSVLQEEAVRDEGRSFVERVFSGATTALLHHFVEDGDLSEDDILELKELLERKRLEREGR